MCIRDRGNARRERKQQEKKVKKEQEAEPEEAKSMFGKINTDERVRPGPVSYTHLDVYKRQLYRCGKCH